MNDSSQITEISENELKTLLYPKENSRFALALVLVLLPISIVGLLLTYYTRGTTLLFIGMIILPAWFSLEIYKAFLIANTVRVSENNFPEVHALLEETKQLLNYSKKVDIYIAEDGSVNAFLAKFFTVKFIVLNSELAKDMIDGDKRIQMKWILGRFIGALKAKHLRLSILNILINSIEKLAIFNLFLLPYERATQYSGDQIGLAVCGELNSALLALSKFMIGNDLSKRIDFRGLLDQAHDSHNSFFGWLSQLLFTHPHLTNRYLNLLAFAKYKYRESFDEYVSQFDNITAIKVESLLPRYFQ